MKTKRNKCLALLLTVALLFTSIPAQVYATESDATNVEDKAFYFEQEPEYLSIETSAPTISFFGTSSSGVSLKDSNEVEWIDRIVIPEEVRDFYELLEEGVDDDGVDDLLIDDGYFDISAGDQGITVTCLGDIVESPDSNTALAYAYYVYEAVAAAFFAFDRDHPEVFWLDGGCYMGYGYGANNLGDGTYQYYAIVSFYTKCDGFDIRNENYQSQAIIETAIAKRDADASAIITPVSGASNYEKICHFNEILTTTNEYNTSSDLNNILHEGRECIGALSGNTGTNGPVCEAYARAFKVLCDKEGIPCVLVDGDAKTSASDAGGAHMWNYVQLDGAWYAVDVTWNDPRVSGISGAVSGYESEKWLLVGSQTDMGYSVDNMTFIESHPVSNSPSSATPNYTNGPVLNETEYVPTASSVISDVVVTKDGVEQNTFTFGDTITVTAKVTSGGLIASNQTLGLYYEDTLLAESNMADSEGVYTLTYDTTAKKVPGTAAQTLTLRFAGSTTTNPAMSKAETTFSVTIQPVSRTVTFVGDSLTTSYTGSTPNVQILVDGAAYDGAVTYEYKAVGSDTYKTGLPIDAGTYTVRATVAASADGFYAESVSTEATLTIEKSTPSLVIGASYYKDAVTYGDGALVVPSEDEITVTGATYNKVVFTWYEGSVADANKMTIAPVNAGTYVLKAELAAGNNNEAASAEKTIVIQTKEITVTALPYEMKYGDTLPQNINMVSVNTDLADGDAIVSVVLTPSTAAVTTSGTITPSNVVIKNGAEDRTANYDITYMPGTLTITEESITDAKVTLAIPEEGYTYDKTAKEPEVTVVLDGATLVKGTDYTVAYSNNINAGTNTAEVVITGKGNYSGTITKKFSISTVVLVPEVTVASKVYDGTTVAEVSVEVDPENKVLSGDSVVISGMTGTFASKNVGTSITVLIDGGTISGINTENYDVLLPSSASANITARPVTVTADAKSKNYGESDPEWTYTIDNSTPLVSGESLNGALSRTTGENSGTYTIVQNTLTNANNPNYSITYNSASFTINRVSYTATVSETQTILVGDVKFVEPKFMGVNDETVEGTLTYTYNGTSGLTYANVITYLENLPVGTTVSVTYSFVPQADGNYTGTKEGTITLNVRDIEFVIGTASATIDNAVTVKENPVYGDAWSDIVIINTGLTAVRGAESDTDDAHFTLSVTGKPNAGEQTYTVWYNGELGGKTYTNVMVCSGTVTVAKKSVAVAAGTYKVSKVYDGTTNPGTGSGTLDVSGILTSDANVAVDVAIGAYTNANVGGQSSIEATLTLSGEGKDNYQLANTTVTVPCEILKKAVTPEILVSGTYTYTGSAIMPTYAVQADGVALAETDYEATVSDNVNAGIATISIVEKAGGNYTWVAEVKQTFVIAKAVYTGEQATDVRTRFGNEGSVELSTLLPEGAKLGTLVVTDNDTVLSASSLDGTTLKYSIVADENVVGKSAVITVPVTETKNYEAFDITVTITVSDKLEQTEFAFAEDSVVKTYGDANFSVAVAGQVEGSTVTYTSSNPEVATVDANGIVTILKAGTTTITATASETNDYHAATDTYVLSVSKIALTWDTTGIYAVDREDDIVNSAATLYGKLQVSGILEADAETAVFTCPADLLAGTYNAVAAGEQTVVLVWADATNPAVLTGSKAENYEMPASLPQIIGTINAVEELPQEADGDVEYKLIVENGISQVPDALKNKEEWNTPDKIENEIRAALQRNNAQVTATDIEISDVALLMNVDGTGWVDVTAANFPAEGVTIVLPYPAGTSASTHNFVVAHLFTEDVNGYQAGEIEYPTVMKTANGIRFTVNGLSPIAVGWSRVPQVTPDWPSVDDTVPTSPKTGYDMSVTVWMLFLAVAGVVVANCYRRKYR